MGCLIEINHFENKGHFEKTLNRTSFLKAYYCFWSDFFRSDRFRSDLFFEVIFFVVAHFPSGAFANWHFSKSPSLRTGAFTSSLLRSDRFWSYPFPKWRISKMIIFRSERFRSVTFFQVTIFLNWAFLLIQEKIIYPVNSKNSWSIICDVINRLLFPECKVKAIFIHNCVVSILSVINLNKNIRKNVFSQIFWVFLAD